MQVQVNGEVLAWTRNHKQLSLAQAAIRLKEDEESLRKMESGERHPSLTELRKIARKYEVPLATLLMPEPKITSQRPAPIDFRVIEGKTPSLSTDLQNQIDFSWELSEIVTEIFRYDESNFHPHASLTYVSNQSDPVSLASEERQKLGYTTGNIPSNPRSIFRFLRILIEKRGIITLMKRLPDDSSCRGFALFHDQLIPVVFINSADFGSANLYHTLTFSLLHEYCHLLLRKSAVGGYARSSNTEKFCNRFAAHFLIPEDEFREFFNNSMEENIDSDLLARACRRFKISKSQAILHLEDLNLAPIGSYDGFIASYPEIQKVTSSNGGGPVNLRRVYNNKFGSRLISKFDEWRTREYISSYDIYEILNIKPDAWIDTVEESKLRNSNDG